MQKKWTEIITALVLGFLIPSILFSRVIREPVQTQQPATEPTETQETVIQPQGFQISVLMDDGSISKMELEAYLTAVVLREMPANFEVEALKAQAVVARTYVLRRLESGGKHVGAVICTNPSCCQGYRSCETYLAEGGTQELLNKVADAVSDTAGQVLVYDGALIDATYFSCSGGMTEDAKAVWGADIPYLQATASPGEEKAAHYVDTATFTTSEFARLLDLELSGKPERWIGNVTYTDGGGVDEILICGKSYKGTTLRQKLNLRSTAFVISVIGNTVTITTKGFGHRVGMSQYGADAMAVQGSSYQEILSYYYRGTELVTYSSN